MHNFPLKKIEDKILTKKKLKKWWKKNGEKKIVFTNWCFDLLHYGHLYYLAEASLLWDTFIVAINSDKSIKQIKGIHRPINNEISRVFQIASLNFVDAVIIFEENTPENLIKLIKPDVLVKWGDYKIEEVIWHEIVKKYGGDIKVTKLISDYSTSNLEKKILSNKINNI